VNSVCQLLKKFFAKSRGQPGLSSYLPFLFESKYIKTKGILKYNGKFLEGISSDQEGGVDISLHYLRFYRKKSNLFDTRNWDKY
jgi:hypothetical protein